LKREVNEMVKVSIEVRNGAARFRVAVRAESIERAVSLAGERFPGRTIKVSFPINPEDFFVEAPAARTVEFEQKLAA
jgi:hypothetical protein